jgi:DNA-binding response OmpR family regulator
MAKPWAIEPIEDEGLVDVLFVGTDSDLADMYRLKLELDGYRVRTATTLRNWSGPRPDLVFLDLAQADGSGFAELSRLRSNQRLAGVPAILLVSGSDAQLEARGLNLTPQEYLLRARPSFNLQDPVSTWNPEAAPAFSWGHSQH